MKEAQARCDSREFAEWMVYDRVEPFGAVRDDLRIAQLCALTVNMQRARGSRAAKVSDFMFDFNRKTKTKVQSAKQIQTVFGTIAQASNQPFKHRVEAIH